LLSLKNRPPDDADGDITATFIFNFIMKYVEKNDMLNEKKIMNFMENLFEFL
jgi:hypothetical protein